MGRARRHRGGQCARLPRPARRALQPGAGPLRAPVGGDGGRDGDQPLLPGRRPVLRAVLLAPSRSGGRRSFLFFFNHTAPTETYTLSLHDALPILLWLVCTYSLAFTAGSPYIGSLDRAFLQDRKSTRLNSSHRTISYAVFCLK